MNACFQIIFHYFPSRSWILCHVRGVKNPKKKKKKKIQVTCLLAGILNPGHQTTPDSYKLFLLDVFSCSVVYKLWRSEKVRACLDVKDRYVVFIMVFS